MCPTLPCVCALGDLPQPFVKNIHGSIGISVESHAAVGTNPMPYSKILRSGPTLTTMAAGLAGSIEPIHGD